MFSSSPSFSLLNFYFGVATKTPHQALSLFRYLVTSTCLSNYSTSHSRLLIVSLPTTVEECFTKNDVVFANRPRSTTTDHLLNNYSSFLLAPYGDLWRSLRRLTNNDIFSPKSLQKFTKLKEEEVCSIIHHVFENVSNVQSQEINLNYRFSVLVFNITTRISIGKQWIREARLWGGNI
ncbi:Cytochrome P [Trema orientale]|uniref:Cytochrome P n=1 Tax=Trema orientale TaxID=63057 RepID=A0A2P5AMN3_TREOI|nr:Cytochrome P [Trema orientale]